MKMLSALVIAVATVQTSTTLSDQDITAAIAVGKSLNLKVHQIGFLKSGSPGGFNILIRGPLGRITAAAATATAKFLPFQFAQVTPEMTAPVLAVWLEPVPPEFYGGSWTVTKPVKAVVIRPKVAAAVVQPISLHREPRTYQNGFGATFHSEAAGALFPIDAIPPGDFELLTVGDRGTGSVTIRAKDREKLR